MFSPLFVWAGRPRTVGISKGGTPFCPPQNIDHVSGLHVNGKVLNSLLIAPNTVRFSGECGAGCTFTVTVQDNGEPGTLDTFGLDVTGTKNEHRSLRVISRENIQFHF